MRDKPFPLWSKARSIGYSFAIGSERHDDRSWCCISRAKDIGTEGDAIVHRDRNVSLNDDAFHHLKLKKSKKNERCCNHRTGEEKMDCIPKAQHRLKTTFYAKSPYPSL